MCGTCVCECARLCWECITSKRSVCISIWRMMMTSRLLHINYYRVFSNENAQKRSARSSQSHISCYIAHAPCAMVFISLRFIMEYFFSVDRFLSSRPHKLNFIESCLVSNKMNNCPGRVQDCCNKIKSSQLLRGRFMRMLLRQKPPKFNDQMYQCHLRLHDVMMNWIHSPSRSYFRLSRFHTFYSSINNNSLNLCGFEKLVNVSSVSPAQIVKTERQQQKKQYSRFHLAGAWHINKSDKQMELTPVFCVTHDRTNANCNLCTAVPWLLFIEARKLFVSLFESQRKFRIE